MLLASLVLVACPPPPPKSYDTSEETDADTDTDTDTDTDADADSDADTDTDTDTDTDSDTDTDTDTDTDALCEQSLSTDAPAGPDCVTTTIGCDETIEATTDGGNSEFGGDAYSSWFCLAGPEDYAGSERVFLLEMERDADVTVTLESPCGDVDLVAARWQYEDCPSEASNLSVCEGSDDEGDDSVLLDAAEGYRFLIIVDSKDEVVTNFRLSTSCDEN